MIGSRVVGLLRNVSRSQARQNLLLTNLQQQVRHDSHGGGWNYRSVGTPPAWATRGATASACLVWWWIYWNLYHGYGHIIGLYDGDFLPNPRRAWSDEELGIPPDDA